LTAASIPLPDLVARLAQQARALGFDLFGVAPAVTPRGYQRLDEWIEAGYAADMTYFADRLPAYANPAKVLADVRSVIVLSYPYRSVESDEWLGTQHDSHAERPQARIARYARGPLDYHDVIHPLLQQIKDSIRAACPDAQSRGVVDTAPIMEREFAMLAGLGWAGKNSLLLNRRRGSYFFLACVLTTLDLPVDQPHETSHCGTCTRCLDACPTDAFAAPGVVDSRRCISYLTIEHRGVIPLELRTGIGDRMFGCDICQEVCPWNRHATNLPINQSPTPAEPAAISSALDPTGKVDLIELLSLDEATFRQRFRHTPMWRPRRRGMLRNAAICAGNARSAIAGPALVKSLDDPEPLIRGAAAWALGQIGGHGESLQRRLDVESDEATRHEIESALHFHQ